MQRATLEELENTDDFIQRHIGPSESQRKAMARAMGYPDLQALIHDTIPDGILRSQDMDLPGANTEQAVLQRLRDIA